MIRKFLFIISSVLVLAGCHSDIYYQTRAVERARKFLLENNKDLKTEDRLSVADMNFVRYNAPVLLHNDVLGDTARPRRLEHLQSEIEQICVTWQIPGHDKLYMVFGVSNASMAMWHPERVIVKSFTAQEVPVLTSAIMLSRAYAQKNFFSTLSIADVNKIRFTYPSLLRSSFKVNFDINGKDDEKAIKKRKAAASKRIQYSLLWKISAGNLVFTGFADPGFKKWTIAEAGFVSDKELAECTEAVVMTPSDGLKALPESEKNILPKNEQRAEKGK